MVSMRQSLEILWWGDGPLTPNPLLLLLQVRASVNIRMLLKYLSYAWNKMKIKYNENNKFI